MPHDSSAPQNERSFFGADETLAASLAGDYQKLFFHQWDWKEQPNIQEINDSLKQFGGPAQIHEIDTKSDFYLIVVYSRGEVLPSDDELIDLYHESLD